MLPDRVQPHSLEAERALLGAALLSAAAWPRIAAAVGPSDFYRDAHRAIFDAMARVAERGLAVDFVTVTEELSRAKRLDDAGGPAYVAGLTDGLPATRNVDSYAAVVREKAQYRRLIAELAGVIGASYDEAKPSAELIDEAVGRLVRIVSVDRTGATDLADAVRDYVAALQAGTAPEPVPTGYADFDALVGGVKPEDVVVVAARPSVGKTSWAFGAAEQMARAGVAALFFSLEMGLSGLSPRALGWRAGVSIDQAIRGGATIEQYAAIAEAASGFDDLRLRIQPSASTVTEIDAWCRRTRQEWGALGLVVVDYIQLLAGEGQSDEQRIAGISRGLKRLAKELRVPVLALSQLNRAPEGRADKRPHTSDLRGSGALEQDADMVVLLHRPEMYQRTEENDGVAEVIVAKHRNGPAGIVRMYFQKSLARFCDLAKDGGV